jgi:hypothetical protein
LNDALTKVRKNPYQSPPIGEHVDTASVLMNSEWISSLTSCN